MKFLQEKHITSCLFIQNKKSKKKANFDRDINNND